MSALRLALPGAPGLRELAKKLGCSHESVRLFESGERMLPDSQIDRLAKLSRLAPDEIRRRFWYFALERMEHERRRAHEELKALGVSAPRRRSGRRSA